MKPNFFATSLIMASTMALSAQAAELKSDYVTMTAGWYDLIDQDNQAVVGGLEYRFAPYNYGVRPMVGISATTDGAVYGYAGLHWDVAILPNKLYISPNFAAGAYAQGDGKDLGGAIQFRSGLEIAYQFPNKHRLGTSIYHISNASIYDKNPGTEAVIVTYSIPTASLF